MALYINCKKWEVCKNFECAVKHIAVSKRITECYNLLDDKNKFVKTHYVKYKMVLGKRLMYAQQNRIKCKGYLFFN